MKKAIRASSYALIWTLHMLYTTCMHYSVLVLWLLPYRMIVPCKKRLCMCKGWDKNNGLLRTHVLYFQHTTSNASNACISCILTYIEYTRMYIYIHELSGQGA